MKRLFNLWILVAVVAMSFASCSKDRTVDEPIYKQPHTLRDLVVLAQPKPEQENLAATRTEFVDADHLLSWTSDDRIAVAYTYNETNIWRGSLYPSTKITLTGSEGDEGASATFTIGGVEVPDEATSNFTFYGFNPYWETSNDPVEVNSLPTINLMISREQTMPRLGTYDPKGDLMLAKSEPVAAWPTEEVVFNYTRLVSHGAVTLRNLPAAEGETVNYVEFVTRKGGLAGAGIVNLVEQTLTPTDATSATNSLRVHMPEGTVAAAGDSGFTVWFCAYPFSLTEGEELTVNVYTTQGLYTRTIAANANGIHFNRNKYATLRINMASAEFNPVTVSGISVDSIEAALGGELSDTSWTEDQQWEQGGVTYYTDKIRANHPLGDGRNVAANNFLHMNDSYITNLSNADTDGNPLVLKSMRIYYYPGTTSYDPASSTPSFTVQTSDVPAFTEDSTLAGLTYVGSEDVDVQSFNTDQDNIPTVYIYEADVLNESFFKLYADGYTLIYKIDVEYGPAEPEIVEAQSINFPAQGGDLTMTVKTRYAEGYTLTATIADGYADHFTVGEQSWGTPDAYGYTDVTLTLTAAANTGEETISTSATLQLIAEAADATYPESQPLEAVITQTTMADANAYVLLTDVAQLTEGSEVIFAQPYDVEYEELIVMGAQSGADRGVTTITIEKNTAQILEKNLTDAVVIFTVEVTEEGQYRFKDGENGYLLGVNANDISTGTATDARDKWTIATAEAEYRMDVMNAEYTERGIQLNSSSKNIFACYKMTQLSPSIFYRAGRPQIKVTDTAETLIKQIELTATSTATESTPVNLTYAVAGQWSDGTQAAASDITTTLSEGAEWFHYTAEAGTLTYWAEDNTSNVAREATLTLSLQHGDETSAYTISIRQEKACEPLKTPVVKSCEVTDMVITITLDEESMDAKASKYTYVLTGQNSEGADITLEGEFTDGVATISDSGLAQGKLYSYVVTAVGDGVLYASSSTTSASIEIPIQIVQLTISNLTANQSSASWSVTPQAAQSFKYLISTNATEEAATIAENGTEVAGGTEQEIDLSGFEFAYDTNYYLHVVAYGDGTYTSDSEVTTSSPINVPDPNKGFMLLTSTNIGSFTAGSQLLITSGTGSSVYALGNQANNNRSAVNGIAVENGNLITNTGSATILTLGVADNGNYTLYDDGSVSGTTGYLYAASSSNNHLKTQTTNNANGQWTIEVTDTGVATVKAQGSYTRNWLRKNSSSAIFSCYGSGQSDIYIFFKPATTDPLVTGKQVSVAAEGGEIALTAGDHYTVQNSESTAVTITGINSDWISYEGTTLTVAANYTGAKRTGEVSISLNGTSATGTITIEQAADEFSVSPSTITLGADAGSTANFTVTSTYGWELSTLNGVTTSISDNVVTVTADAAGGETETELGALTITREDGKELTVTVKQAATSTGGGDEGGEPTPEDAELSFADTANRTSYSTTQQVWEQNGITLTNNKSSSTTNVADYANPVRFYASSEIIIEAPGNITQIVFTADAAKYATPLKNSIGTAATVSGSTVTVTLDGSSSTFTIAKLTAQVRLDSLVVTYLSPAN